MKKTNFVVLAAPLLMFALALPSHADTTNPTTCKDGTTSAATGRGACSGHGGVQKAAKSTAAATTGNATAATAAAPAATPTPSGAASPSAPAATAAKSTASVSKSVPSAPAGNTDPTGATAKCKDGTYSKSKHHSGTCSHHGGVANWLTTPQ
ncbi:MAG TPA: DUF3761 domain-containing protein [Steroidobacteraceae bacterium]|nr:DUF3761 domain-containing protein [Steroidobacteraceae bacterium]